MSHEVVNRWLASVYLTSGSICMVTAIVVMIKFYRTLP